MSKEPDQPKPGWFWLFLLVAVLLDAKWRLPHSAY